LKNNRESFDSPPQAEVLAVGLASLLMNGSTMIVFCSAPTGLKIDF
jgi:hypothetical protein